MNTLKIEIPDGYEIDSFDKTTGQVRFKPKPRKVTERIKTIADVLDDNNIKQREFDDDNIGLSDDEVGYRLAKLLAKSLNEGWTPDWNNASQPKYTPWFYLGGSSGFRFGDYGGWGSLSFVGSRLCYKSRELVEHIGAHPELVSIYKKFML